MIEVGMPVPMMLGRPKDTRGSITTADGSISPWRKARLWVNGYSFWGIPWASLSILFRCAFIMSFIANCPSCVILINCPYFSMKRLIPLVSKLWSTNGYLEGNFFWRNWIAFRTFSREILCCRLIASRTCTSTRLMNDNNRGFDFETGMIGCERRRTDLSWSDLPVTQSRMVVLGMRRYWAASLSV